MDFQLLSLFNTLQFLGKNYVSDLAIAHTLQYVHSEGPPPGMYGRVQVLDVSLDTMRRYVSPALRESKYQRALMNNLVRDAAHPPDQPGSALGDCTVCAQGLDPQRPLPVQADELANSQNVSPIQGGIRFSKV